MPRKPTHKARSAREKICKRVASTASNQPLPPLRVLSKEYGLHPSTLFRMLEDLSMEGKIWQSPGGRFFPATARQANVRGMPICFIGREMSHWSRLYQEILEGVSEVCSANEGSLILSAAPSLVQQSDSTQAPRFASLETQKRELENILKNVPRGCAGFILDHLWMPEAIESAPFPGGAKVQIFKAPTTRDDAEQIDEQRGARLVRSFLEKSKYPSTMLVIPFVGDAAIDRSVNILLKELAEQSVTAMPFADVIKKVKSLHDQGTLFICPEDNTSAALAEMLAPHVPRGAFFPLIATQGTGTLSAPISRLRYDFKRLGRATASSILNGNEVACIKPALIIADNNPVFQTRLD